MSEKQVIERIASRLIGIDYQALTMAERQIVDILVGAGVLSVVHSIVLYNR